MKEMEASAVQLSKAPAPMAEIPVPKTKELRALQEAKHSRSITLTLSGREM
jgi:hypothetical protein